MSGAAWGSITGQLGLLGAGTGLHLTVSPLPPLVASACARGKVVMCWHHLHPADRKGQCLLGCCVPGCGAKPVCWHDPAASTLLPFLLLLEEKQTKIRETSAKHPNVPNCQLLGHLWYRQHISVPHACSLVVIFSFPYIFFGVCILTTKKPRLKETIESDFHTPVSRGEDRMFTDKHPTHALSSTTSETPAPGVRAKSTNAHLEGSFISSNFSL